MSYVFHIGKQLDSINATEKNEEGYYATVSFKHCTNLVERQVVGPFKDLSMFSQFVSMLDKCKKLCRGKVKYPVYAVQVPEVKNWDIFYNTDVCSRDCDVAFSIPSDIIFEDCDALLDSYSLSCNMNGVLCEVKAKSKTKNSKKHKLMFAL